MTPSGDPNKVSVDNHLGDFIGTALRGARSTECIIQVSIYSNNI